MSCPRPHVRLVGLNAMAQVESAKLAKAFLAASSPRLDKRYGGRLTAKVVSVATMMAGSCVSRFTLIPRLSEVAWKQQTLYPTER